MLKKYDVIIIGAGPSGIYSGFLASLHNLNILILEASSDLGGQIKLFMDKPVFDMPGHLNVFGKDILKLMNEQLYSNDNFKIKYNEEVIKVEGKIRDFTVKTQNSIYKSQTIIIASGGGLFKPIPFGIKNESQYNNIKYKISNTNKYFGKRLAIFGGGDTAVDWANYFYKKKSKVTLIHRRTIFRAQEKLFSEIEKKIDIYTPYKIVSVKGAKNVESVKVINIKSKEVKEINCDYVLVFFGQQKLTSKENRFLIDMDKNGYFVKSNMETSRSGIFAIGNVANYLGKVKMMITGLGEGATAVGSAVEIINPSKKMSYYVKKNEK